MFKLSAERNGDSKVEIYSIPLKLVDRIFDRRNNLYHVYAITIPSSSIGLPILDSCSGCDKIWHAESLSYNPFTEGYYCPLCCEKGY